jgi:hypothetical protein
MAKELADKGVMWDNVVEYTFRKLDKKMSDFEEPTIAQTNRVFSSVAKQMSKQNPFTNPNGITITRDNLKSAYYEDIKKTLVRQNKYDTNSVGNYWRNFAVNSDEIKEYIGSSTYAEGGNIEPIEIDEDGSNLPPQLYELFGELDEDNDPYKEMERLRLKAHKIGYDFDYDLSGQATEFWKIEKANAGYLTMSKGGSTYAEGGEIYVKAVQIGFDIALSKGVTAKQVEEFFEYRVAPFIDNEYRASTKEHQTMYVLNGVYSSEDMTSDYKTILEEEISDDKTTYVKAIKIGLDIALTEDMTFKQVENYAEHELASFINGYDDGEIYVLNGVYSAEDMTSDYKDHFKEINSYADGGGINSFNPIKNRPVTYILKDKNGKEVFKTKSGNKASDERVTRFVKGEETSVLANDSKGNKKQLFKLQSEENGSTYAEGGEINDYNFGYVIKDEDGDVIHESVFRHVGKNEADAKNKAKKYLKENKFDIIDGLEMGLEEDEVSIEIVNAYAEGGEIKDQLVRVLKDSGFNNIKGKPLNEYTHNRGHIVAVVTRDSVHLSNYTPNTHRFLGSTSFDNPKKLAEYFDKNQTYAKGGSTYAEGGEIKLYDVVVYWEDEDEESGDKEFTGIVADSEEQAEKIAKGLMEEDFYGMEVTEPSITYASVTERDSTYAEGGGIKGNYFEGELSFLNW